MKTTLARRLTSIVLLLALSAGCRPPKYATYESINKDFSALVPWGWQVMTDQQDSDFAQTTFIGPFDREFYLGAPSLSVRWYRRHRAHRLSGGRLEMYSSAEDFISQMLSEVYGPRPEDYAILDLGEKLSFTEGPGGKVSEVIPEMTLHSSGLKAKVFVVVSETPAPENVQWGVFIKKDSGKPYVHRKHAYAVVPVENGFYVLTYPATLEGYPNHESKFRGLIGSFMPRTAGPGGPKIRVPGPK